MSSESWKFDGFRVCAMRTRGENDGRWYWKATTQGKRRRFVWSGWGCRESEDVKEAIRAAAKEKHIAPRSEPPCDVHSVAWWAKRGHFRNEHEVRGAMRLAYQQGLDGMGPGAREWMGLTEKEFDQWMRDDR